jgi:hypothetical protein
MDVFQANDPPSITWIRIQVGSHANQDKSIARKDGTDVPLREAAPQVWAPAASSMADQHRDGA